MPRAVDSTTLPGMSAQIRIDAKKCRGHGLCMLAAPKLFRMAGLGMAQASDCDLSDRRVRKAADRAVHYCCEDAITIDEVD